ncbi:MAG: acetolactate synthase small subunit [Fibrobacteria bacterium]|nr:acetolactate synthase small subunit [Fibrobacteria bacterium]
MQQHTISLMVSNKPGVLIRISMVFSRRGYNLESLVVSPAHNPEFSRMTLVATGHKKILEQIIKQLNKLVDVIHANDHTAKNVIEKEMALIKVNCPVEVRTEVLQILEHFKCSTLDITETTLLLQVTGSSDKLNSLYKMLDGYGILESVRSGKLIMARGTETT